VAAVRVPVVAGIAALCRPTMPWQLARHRRGRRLAAA